MGDPNAIERPVEIGVPEIQEVGEPGLENVSVRLLDNLGANTLDTTVTDANGEYTFEVLPGAYVLEFVAPADFDFSPQDQGGDDALDSDANAVSRPRWSQAVTRFASER